VPAGPGGTRLLRAGGKSVSRPIAVEVFSSPACAKCLHAKTMLRALAAELGAKRVIWREVDILAETERAIQLGVLSAPAIAIDGVLVFPSLPRPERLRKALLEQLKAR
jgi:protein-disulfide isomerase